MSSKRSFETLLDMLHDTPPAAYDMTRDPNGELFWRRVAATLAAEEPFTLESPPVWDLEGITGVVDAILEQFRFLIEDRRFSEELYDRGTPRPEKAAQRLFFAVAYAYCKANNLDLTPEADTGNGPVDFKISSGFQGRVLVEIKLSTNTKLVKGYSRQLEAYKSGEETSVGYYVVLDVGGMGKKGQAVMAERNRAISRHERVSPIIFIDGIRRISASKR